MLGRCKELAADFVIAVIGAGFFTLLWWVLMDAASVRRASGAPAPTRKAKIVPPVPSVKSLVGQWVLLWRGSDYDMVLSAGGAYWARGINGTQEWVGTWAVKGGRLHVSETTIENALVPGATPLVWDVDVFLSLRKAPAPAPGKE